MQGGMLLFFLSSSPSANRPAKKPKIPCFPSLISPSANIHEEQTRERRRRRKRRRGARRKRRRDTRLRGSARPCSCYCRSSNRQLNLEGKRKVMEIFFFFLPLCRATRERERGSLSKLCWVSFRRETHLATCTKRFEAFCSQHIPPKTRTQLKVAFFLKAKPS